MPLYQVGVQELWETTVNVVAEDEQAARAAAIDLIGAGCYPNGDQFPEKTYMDTCDASEWYVSEIKRNPRDVLIAATRYKLVSPEFVIKCLLDELTTDTVQEMIDRFFPELTD